VFFLPGQDVEAKRTVSNLIERVRRDRITRALPELVTYGITADEALRFGMPCGGTLQQLHSACRFAGNLDDP
jgi:xanthine dehydrogenase accessory factor